MSIKFSLLRNTQESSGLGPVGLVIKLVCMSVEIKWSSFKNTQVDYPRLMGPHDYIYQ